MRRNVTLFALLISMLAIPAIAQKPPAGADRPWHSAEEGQIASESSASSSRHSCRNPARSGHCRAIANFRESQLQHVAPGMRANVYVMSRPDIRIAGVVESIGLGVTPDPDVMGRLEPGLPDVQRTLNRVHPASRYPVRVRIDNPSPALFRVGESAVMVLRGK
jgi:hypothetical protein